jgi:hypothetical protein
MLDFARDIVSSQPILTAFLAIGLGYLVGQISIGGFSLGVGAVLFVGLAIGAFAPKAQGSQTRTCPSGRAQRSSSSSPLWGRTDSKSVSRPRAEKGDRGHQQQAEYNLLPARL